MKQGLINDDHCHQWCTLSFGQPSRILHADGYVDVSGQMPVFYYHLKDHLGNVRSVITPGTGNQPEIVQAMEYFPFGMSFESPIPIESEQSHMPNKHTYNSKLRRSQNPDASGEEQEMPGRWLDYGARFYDPSLGRFHTVDPLAHSFPNQSPYVYAANNPISFIDFMGLSAMSDIATRRASSFTLEMNNEQWMNATRPTGIAGVESNEKTKKTDKKTESQTGQQSTNGKKKKDGIGKVHRQQLNDFQRKELELRIKEITFRHRASWAKYVTSSDKAPYWEVSVEITGAKPGTIYTAKNVEIWIGKETMNVDIDYFPNLDGSVTNRIDSPRGLDLSPNGRLWFYTKNVGRGEILHINFQSRIDYNKYNLFIKADDLRKN